METQAQAKQLWFHYTDENGERTSPDILKDISLSIDKGDFVALLGHNGSGKSTFAKHMNAILLPSAGTMTVDGIDTKDESQRFTLRSHVGMVFQNPDNQIVATIVEEDVAFGPENLGIPPQEIRERVDDALKAVEMYEYREHAPSQLSGGQKQRVAIAGIIAMRPDCIVLDEPTAMLDPSGRREVMNTIHMLNREYGITIVLITHYMEEAAQANRVVVMDDGKVVLDNTPKEVFSHVETLKKIGLDVPQVTELAYRLQQAGCPVDVHMISEEECVAALTKLLSGKNGRCSMAILKTEDLTYQYSIGTPFEKTAVDHVNLEIEEGAFVGIIGHTGSGKSTLIQHFNGLIRPTSGKIYLDGTDIWADKTNIRQVRFQVGLVFQYPEYQIFEDTVYKDIAFGPRNMGLSEAEIKERVEETAALVGLTQAQLNQSPFDLSGGQKRRVAIAGVMALRPKVLILDEPTAGLDPKGREDILREIRRYHKETGRTVLLVSHSMEDMANCAEKILVMNAGKVFCYDTVENVFRQAKALQEIGLAVPQITRVCMQLREQGIPLSDDIYTVEAAYQQILQLYRQQKEGTEC